jgi:hypothetical protein
MMEERESALDERVRRDAEKAEDNAKRMARLNPVANRETEEPPPEKPKAKPRTSAKK